MKTAEERIMPANGEAERAILGAVLLDTSGFAYNQAISMLRPEDFSLDSHRKIFGRMVEVFEAGGAIDFVTLTEKLGQHREIELVGGTSYVMSLTDGLPRVKNIEHYARIVRDKSRLRQVINFSISASESAYADETPASHIIGIAQEQLLSLLADGNKDHAAKVSEFSAETWQRLIARKESENRLIGFSTGLDSLDFRTTGIRRGEFWTIGGRTGDGKTALALQIAVASASDGIPVAYFSIEMDRHSLLERVWSSAGKVNYKHVKNPKLMNFVEGNSLSGIRDAVDGWPLYVEDAEAYSAAEIEARSRLLIRRHGIGLVIVDYLQIVDAPGRDERAQLTKISKVMRRLAKSENVGVIGLSQMPRPKDQNMNKRPTKFDLKESGSLENDSHTVLLIFRPVDEYDQYTGNDEIVIGKQRSGETGIEPVVYLGQHMRFESRAL